MTSLILPVNLFGKKRNRFSDPAGLSDSHGFSIILFKNTNDSLIHELSNSLAVYNFPNFKRRLYKLFNLLTNNILLKFIKIV